MTERLTVKEFANRAGCTTQAVYKRLHTGELQEYVSTEKPYTISVDALQLFNQPTNQRTTNQPKKKQPRNAEIDLLVEHLQSEVQFLREQNERLTFMLAREQEKNRLLEAPAADPAEPVQAEVQEVGFWGRLFKRGKV